MLNDAAVAKKETQEALSGQLNWIFTIVISSLTKHFNARAQRRENKTYLNFITYWFAQSLDYFFNVKLCTDYRFFSK